MEWGDVSLPNVSVIVPVYNNEAHLRRCLDSLVGQTLEGMEIVLVDDGSTDASPAIMRAYAQKYAGRFKIISKANGGQGSARNLGLEQSEGDYIGFVDADDYVLADMYETLYTEAVKSGSDFVECLYQRIEEGPHGVKVRPMQGHARAYKSNKEMFIDIQVSPCTKLFHRDVLFHPDIVFPEGVIYEDTAFFIKAIPFIRNSSFVNRNLYQYVHHGNSTMTGNRGRRVGEILPVLDDILDFFKGQGFFETYRNELEYFCVKILFCSSFSRIGRVREAAVKNELLDRTFAWVDDHFPHYRKNPYLDGTATGLYIRLVRRGYSHPLAWVLGKVMN